MITACVVSTIPAMEHEFMSPERVTFLGSITPFSIMFTNSPDMALYPISQSDFITFSTMTSPSTPALLAMMRHGASSAFWTISAPSFSSGSVRVSLKSSIMSERCTNAAPPPGTMPSSIAANVAFFASSMRSLRSSSSVSVAAPTLMTATPPLSLAMRSDSFCVS